jgi:hypothetical protein
VALALLLAPGGPASAAGVQLQMANGRVTLHASNATLRQILDEWAKVGHTTIVNAEKVPGGAPLTLDLEDVPEAEALNVLLRSVAGYLAAPRHDAAATLSHFDRILIVPMSAAAPASVPSARPAVAAPTPQRPPGFPPGFPNGSRPPFAGPTGVFTPPQGTDDDAPITNIVMPNRGAVFNGFQQPQLVPAGGAGQQPTEEAPPEQVIAPNGTPSPSIPGATVDQFGGTSIPGVVVQPQQRAQQPGASSTGR